MRDILGELGALAGLDTGVDYASGRRALLKRLFVAVYCPTRCCAACGRESAQDADEELCPVLRADAPACVCTWCKLWGDMRTDPSLTQRQVRQYCAEYAQSRRKRILTGGLA